MGRFLLIRLGQMVLTIYGTLTLLFILLRASGDPALIFAGPSPTADMVQAARVRLGLDQSLPQQYLEFLGGISRLDFGDSFAYSRPAFPVVAGVVGASLSIVGLALVVAVLLAFGVGIVAAVAGDTVGVRVMRIVTFVGQSVPFFWLALLLVLWLAITWRILPATGTDGVQSIVLPAAALAVPQVSTLSRLVRSQMLNVLGQGYIRTARSKGLAESPILYVHALPNSLPPLVSWISIQFAFMLGALVVLEPLFNYQGLGALLVRGVNGRDYPVVQAGIFLVSVLVVSVNLIADLMNYALDPRHHA